MSWEEKRAQKESFGWKGDNEGKGKGNEYGVGDKVITSQSQAP